jgi:ATP-dependent helicase/nuclease subunit A
MDEATRAQNRAARPDVSTWLTANAGSGKTRVLISRVARLLLGGVPPENILCLTYTTAAASEMQNRLFKTLGGWSMLPDGELQKALGELGEQAVDDLARARTLFASAIEAPGGLKIQTIHSFCSKVLRQFPLEAGVNPQFREMDEVMQAEVIRDVIEDIARHQPGVVERVQRAYSGDSIAELAKDIARKADAFGEALSRQAIFGAYGVAHDRSRAGIVQDAISADDISFLKGLVPILREPGGTNDGKLADALSNLPDRPSLRALLDLEDCLLFKAQAKKAFSLNRNIPTKGVRENLPFAPLLPEFVAIGERVERARQQRVAVEAAEHATALNDFAQAFLPRYRRAKADGGFLDFDDLIRLTKQLLTERSLAWVLYRLDSRIDHILVDEAQDTAPEQWDIIEALTEEIVAGDSGRDRTLFVVGDKKQSIYSFQGADAEGFDARGDAFDDRLAHGAGLARGELLHSFRSSPAILGLVDVVFSETDGTGEPTRHRAFRETMPGRVDLWPLVPRPEKEEERPWYDASERVVDSDAPHQLAQQVAQYMEQLLDSGTIQDKEGHFRLVRPGDIMVLVQRRSALFDKIISACKARKLEIAGADRLKVGSELAVRDLLALLSFLALPEDDLSLAAALRSPLLGWSEGDLYNLAANRKNKTYLWQALRNRREDFPETFETLTALRKRVDYDRPYELIHAILTRFEGRQRLLARLGPEAEEGIDELLNQALSYEAAHVPSLTGFLTVARASDIEVKREVETDGNLIRVMTVHGSKGLESPIVILPDTTFSQPRDRQVIVKGPGDIAALTQSAEKGVREMTDAKERLKSEEAAERDRLLYVAMTRAERWLIVCGVQPAREAKSRLNWHQKVQTALEHLDPVPIGTPTGPGLRHQIGDWPEVPEDSQPSQAPDHPETSEIELRPVPPVPESTVLSPSKLGGPETLVGDSEAVSGGVTKGRRMHLLLEHLPRATEPLDVATALLSVGPDAAPADEIRLLTDEALEIIANHAEIFGHDSFPEVEIAAFSPTLGQRISGAIDRLVIGDKRILAVDFKSNAVVPGRPEDTPEGILRQMGAYLEALEAIYPNRVVEVSVLWTTSGELMPLERGILRDALQRATTS